MTNVAGPRGHAGTGQRPDRRAGPHPAVLHPGRGLRRPAHAAPDRRPAAPTTSTGTAGRHDKVVRSTHGVNCTGSCSWKVYVKDGIITWESQQTDYPSVGPGPAGVRAARLPARRGVLLVHLLAHPGALPVRARRAAGDVPRGEGAPRRPGAGLGRHRRPTRSGAARYKAARGKGGLVRADAGTRRSRWSPPRTCTPSRRTARTGSPASRRSRRCRWSSHAAGARFISLIGGVDAVVLRLVRRPAGRLAAGVRRPDRRARVRRLVGRRLPDDVGLQRPGHPHPGRALDGRGPLPRPEGRRGVARTTPTTSSSPTSGWPPQPGTDGALAMAMGHVILKEFFVDRQTPRFTDYVKRYTDLPFLVTLEPSAADGYVPGQVPHRRRPRRRPTPRTPRSRPCCWTRPPASRSCRTARSGFRFGEAGAGQVEPRPRRRRPAADRCAAAASAGRGGAAALRQRRRRRRDRCAAACRSGGSAGTW